MNIHIEKSLQVYDLNQLGLLKISGAGAARLLQGQLTCDIPGIQSGGGTMAAHCNPQGRIISLFHIARIQEDFYLILPQDLLKTAMTALKKYAPFFKADIEDVTGSLTLAGFENGSPPSEAAAVMPLPGSQRTIALLTKPIAAHASLSAWHHLDMLEGIPSLYACTSGEFLPHDLNLPQLNAVSFTKGCYTGQEIIARMHYRGKPKNHLYRGTTTAAVSAGSQLFAKGNPAGTVIDCSEIVYNNQRPLLFVSNEASWQSEQLTTEDGQLIEPPLSE